MSRPLVQVYTVKSDKIEGTEHVPLPTVFKSPIRLDVVQYVHLRMNKNHRQPYAVSDKAGHQTSAESWGTGRAVARIPRVSGGGTGRSGQGAFGNMCRKGRLFSPTKIWRRWHAKINVTQRRYAVCSALAASALPALLLARGHRIGEVPEVPLVVASDAINTITKTAKAVALLKALKAYPDVEKVKESHRIRAGKGKMRNRRYVQRRGPLIIYNNNGETIVRAFRNIPGVEFAQVHNLNLLNLAPGGHLGRFIIWTRDAFDQLEQLFGSYTAPSKLKKGFHLPRPLLTNADIGRLINSDEIQSVVRPAKNPTRKWHIKKNPLKNFGVLVRLNPYAQVQRRKQLVFEAARLKKKQELLEAKRKGTKQTKTPQQIKIAKVKVAAKKTPPKYLKTPAVPNNH